MEKWSERQEAIKEGREKDKTRREKLAGYFFDVSKIFLTALVIGSIMTFFSTNTMQAGDAAYLAIAGSILTYWTAWLGNKLLKK